MKYLVLATALSSLFLTGAAIAAPKPDLAAALRAGNLPAPAPGDFIPGKRTDCKGSAPGALDCCLPAHDYVPPLRYNPPGPHRDGDPLDITFSGPPSTTRPYTTHCDGDGTSPQPEINAYAPLSRGGR
jgi:hypothetical protein